MSRDLNDHVREGGRLDSEDAEPMLPSENVGSGDPAASKSTDENDSAVVKLIAIGQKLELFHDGREGAYVKRPVGNGGFRAVPLKGLRSWLASEFHAQSGGKRAASPQAIQSALAVLEARALNSIQMDVHVRVAQLGDTIYVDLGDDAGRAVETDAHGWRIVDKPPVCFRLARGMLPLPVPVSGGCIDELRLFINAPGDDEWLLMVSWLVAAFRPGRPFPIQVLQGEAGSAKSTAARLQRSLIDPSASPLRRPPKEARDLAIAARNGWTLAYDNLSGLSPEMSDLLCCVATGGGFGARQLYEDADEVLFQFCRPVIINGIDEIATRGDFADRALRINMPRIPDSERRDEDALTTAFEKARPRILGALCDAVSGALRELSATRLRLRGGGLPRMADYAQWVAAAEPALGLEPGSFLAAYRRNRGELIEQSLESDGVARALRRLLEAQPDGRWTGTTGDLLDALVPQVGEARQRDWPDSPKKLTNRLRRLAPHLATIGVTWLPLGPRSNRGQIYELREQKVPAKSPSPPSPPSSVDEAPGDGRSGPGVSPSPAPSPEYRPAAPAEEACDGGVGGDADFADNTSDVTPPGTGHWQEVP
ncbi:MAG: hypothetical protein QM723_18375 [Myxococcaceae bacterium]